MMKKVAKKTTKTWEKVFIIISIIIIFIIIGIYAYRAVYYYKKTNYIEEYAKLVDVITNQMNITYTSDGLYKEDNSYYYQGTSVNNYIFYSGRVWRIISIDDIGIKMITDSSETNLVWGNGTDYENSTIYKWLNNDIFLNSLYNKNDVVDATWCNKSVDISNYNCEKDLKASVGLLTIEEYLKAGGVNSYLNNKTYFWTGNASEDNKAYYIHSEGGINNEVSSSTSFYSYGVRPIIYLNKNVLYQKGNGSKEDPYTVGNNVEVEINNHPVGTYLKYNNYIWRIQAINENSTLIILDGYILNEDNEPLKLKYNEVNSYLNKTFIKLFNEEHLEKYNFNKTEYNYKKSYKYSEVIGTSSSYIGIPTVGDLFVPEYDNYWLNSYLDTSLNLIYTTAKGSSLFADFDSSENYIRPIICIKNGLIIAGGSGTKDNPYIIGDK